MLANWQDLPVLLAQEGGDPARYIGVPADGASAPGDATATQPGTGAITPGGAPPPSSSPFQFFLPILLVFMVFMILSSVMGSRKEKKKRAALLAGIHRNDKVQTVGGIIGTVVEVRDDDMVLRVDESSNTRIRFAKSAIQQVLESRGGSKADSPVTVVTNQQERTTV